MWNACEYRIHVLLGVEAMRLDYIHRGNILHRDAEECGRIDFEFLRNVRAIEGKTALSSRNRAAFPSPDKGQSVS